VSVAARQLKVNKYANLKTTCAIGAALASLWLAIPVHAQAQTSTEDALRSYGFAMPSPSDQGPFIDINPGDNAALMSDPALKTIYDSTVLTVLVDKDWNFINAGCATFLAGTSLNGYPMAVSIRHAVDLSLNDIPGGSLVLIDHNGDVLGVGYSITQHVPEGDPAAGYDYPMLIAVNPNYPINRHAMSLIHGVVVSHQLPSGSMVGYMTSTVGTAQGASGGGWYNQNRELIGVIQGFQKTPANEKVSSLDVASVNPFYSALYGRPGRLETRMIEHNTYSYIQSLNVGHVLSQIDLDENVTTNHYTDDVTDLPGSFGFGYPGFMAAMMSGDLTFDPVLDQKYRLDEPDMIAASALEAVSNEKRMQSDPTKNDDVTRYLLGRAVATLVQSP
jgi:hypothetical protein